MSIFRAKRPQFTSDFLVVVATLLAMLGAIVLAWNATEWLISHVDDGTNIETTGDLLWPLAEWGGALAVAYLAFKNMAPLPSEKDPARRSDVLYSRTLTALGLLLLVIGVMNMVSFAAFAYYGWQDKLFPPPGATISTAEATDPSAKAAVQNVAEACRLIFATMMAVLGAIFFNYNAVIELRQAKVPFRMLHFWAGFGFRIGEAVLFVVVVFLLNNGSLIQGTDGTSSSSLFPHAALPIVALFIGMYVKSAERLVHGMGTRILASIDALVAPGGAGKQNQHTFENLNVEDGDRSDRSDVNDTEGSSGGITPTEDNGPALPPPVTGSDQETETQESSQSAEAAEAEQEAETPETSDNADQDTPPESDRSEAAEELQKDGDSSSKE